MAALLGGGNGIKVKLGQVKRKRKCVSGHRCSAWLGLGSLRSDLGPPTLQPFHVR